MAYGEYEIDITEMHVLVRLVRFILAPPVLIRLSRLQYVDYYIQ